MNIIERLRADKLINGEGKISPWLDRKISEHRRQEVINETLFLVDVTVSLFVRVRTLLLNIDSQPTCKVCGGPTRFHSAYKKYADTCSMRCQGLLPENAKLRKKKCLEKFGYECSLTSLSPKQKTINAKMGYVQSFLLHGNPMDNTETRQKHKEITSSKEFQAKRISTLVSKGGKSYVVPTDWSVEFTKYKQSVYHFTRHSGAGLLENYDKRGRSGKLGAHHLDHKYSVLQGFLDNVHPSIIGSIHNLEMIPWKKNSEKSGNSSIALGELFARIEMNKYTNRPNWL